MVLTLESLVSLNSVFKLKLKFGVGWTKFEGDFVNEFAGQGMVRPSLEKLVFLMLEVILTTLEEVT
jgi:hypothetical protein